MHEYQLCFKGMISHGSFAMQALGDEEMLDLEDTAPLQHSSCLGVS